MGAYLMPQTDDVETLERLAGVPAGTMERHDARMTDRPQPADFERYCDYSEANFTFSRVTCEQYPDVHTLDMFLTFGFGKIRSRTRRRLDIGAYGSTRDPDKIRAILAAQKVTLPDGLTVEDLGGLAWG